MGLPKLISTKKGPIEDRGAQESLRGPASSSGKGNFCIEKQEAQDLQQASHMIKPPDCIRTKASLKSLEALCYNNKSKEKETRTMKHPRLRNHDRNPLFCIEKTKKEEERASCGPNVTRTSSKNNNKQTKSSVVMIRPSHINHHWYFTGNDGMAIQISFRP